MYKRNPDNTDAIFAHAQSEFWIGEMHKNKENYKQAMPHWKKYAELGKKLYELDPLSFDWNMEHGWGVNNIALLQTKLKDYESAQKYYLEAINYFEAALDISPDSALAKKELANAFRGVSNTALKAGDKNFAKTFGERQIRLLSDLVEGSPQDIDLKYKHHRAHLNLYIVESQLNPLVCDKIRSDSFIKDFEFFLNYEKTNYDWQFDYILNWYKLLTTCPKIYSCLLYTSPSPRDRG